MKGRLARNTIQTAMILGLRTATQALSLLMLTRLLGVETFGGLISASSLAVVLGIVPTLGAGYVMLALAPLRSDAIEHIWRYAWPLTFATGLTLSALFLPSARLIAGTQALPFNLLLWIAATELLAIPFISLFSFSLQAQGRVPLSQIIQWLPFGFRLVIIPFCFFLNGSADRLHLYIVLQFAATMTALLLSALVIKRYLTLDWSPRLVSKKELADGSRYSAMHIVAANAAEIDKILAIHWLQPQDVGVYAALTRIISALSMPIIALLLSAQPRIFRLAHQPTLAGKNLVKLLGLLSLGWGLMTWMIMEVSAPIIIRLFGQDFSSILQLTPILSAVGLPLALRQTAGVILVALGRPLGRITFEVSGIAILFGSIVTLVPARGVFGLATALIVSETSMALIGWLLVRRLIKKINVEVS